MSTGFNKRGQSVPRNRDLRESQTAVSIFETSSMKTPLCTRYLASCLSHSVENQGKLCQNFKSSVQEIRGEALWF